MKEQLSFDHIAENILKNKKIIKINNETHHGITRMSHSMRVARNVYKISKKLKLDYVSATRAAILHDFFVNEDFGSNHGLIQGVVHPSIALQNALGEFELNEIECNAIESHMFPLSIKLPKYKESWVLTFVDKMIAIYEYFSYKFSYTKIVSTASTLATLAGIFILNLITMGHK